MRNTFIRMCCGMAMMAVLGVPAGAQAQSITESVSKLSSADIQRVLNSTAERGAQAQPAVDRGRSVRKGAIIGALVGLVPGIITGVFINTYCYNEIGSCPALATVVGAANVGLGAGIGAAIGAAAH